MSNYDVDAYNRNIAVLRDMVKDELLYQCETVAVEQNRVAFAYVALACITFAAQIWSFLTVSEPTSYMRFWSVLMTIIEMYVIVSCIGVTAQKRIATIGFTDYGAVLSQVYRWGQEQGSTKKLDLLLITLYEGTLNRMHLRNLRKSVTLKVQAILLMASVLITILCMLNYIVVS